MEKIFNSTWNQYLYIGLSVFFYVMSIFLWIFVDFAAFIFTFLSGSIFLIPFVIFYKRAFSKIVINEEGISLKFKQEVLKFFKWNEIKVIRLVNSSIVISKKDFNTYRDLAVNEKYNIQVHHSNKIEQAIKEFSQFYDEKIIQF